MFVLDCFNQISQKDIKQMQNLGSSEVKRSPKMGKIEHIDAFFACYKIDILNCQCNFQWLFLCKKCIFEHMRQKLEEILSNLVF